MRHNRMRRGAAAFVTVFALAAVSVFSGAAGDAAAYGTAPVGGNPADTASGYDDFAEEQIDEKTVEPECGQPSDGYIVVLDSDLKDTAEADGYTASPSGNYIKVDEPLDALDFTAPSHVIQIIPNNIIYPMDEPGYPYSTNDEYWVSGSQWNLRPYETTVSGVATGYGIGVQALYRRGLNGNGVSVGIFDTGLMAATGGQHPDLRKNFTAEHGINFASMVGDPAPSGDPLPSGAYDRGNHGTMVTGLIAAIANNGIGIAGVADRAEI
ncbi:MAG: S8 family serine peptidase, partial [Clostridiales Family XIII bacterium]|nr:S8 family serine peptidase [Clostridiales Family XIII bacterium]